MTVESFCAGDKPSHEAFPCVRHNAPLIASLEALTVALEILFSPSFANVCGDFVDVLKGIDRDFKLTNSGFLFHSVERVVAKFFRVISKEDTAVDVPGSDVTNPVGCAALLKVMLADLVSNLVDVPKAMVQEKKYTVLMRLAKEATSNNTKESSSKPAEGAEVGNQVTREGALCGMHIGSQLKAKKEGGGLFKCVRAPSCPFRHVCLNQVTKDEVLTELPNMPVWMRSALDKLVEGCSKFKK